MGRARRVGAAMSEAKPYTREEIETVRNVQRVLDGDDSQRRWLDSVDARDEEIRRLNQRVLGLTMEVDQYRRWILECKAAPESEEK